jgi:hypothetical protein
VRIRRFDPAPHVHGFGIVLPEKGTTALPVPAGAESQVRRLDRYGRLGVAVAAAALDAAAATPPAVLDPSWGVMVGSSLGCLESNRAHDRAVREKPLPEMSPALFVRTVSNSVTGDISIAWRLGGPSETFVSGWTAGVDALIAAATALEEGRARLVLAGAVEAPGGPLADAAGTAGPGAAGGMAVGPREAAAMALVAAAPKPGALRLIAAGRGRDPEGRMSLRAALVALAPARVAVVVMANGVPPDLLARWRDEAGQVPIVELSKRTGELGSVGVFAALAGTAAGSGMILAVARGPAGETAVVAALR